MDSLPAETPGKPKNTRVGSLSLLQQILTPGLKLGSPALQAYSLPAKLPGKPTTNWVAEVTEVFDLEFWRREIRSPGVSSVVFF